MHFEVIEPYATPAYFIFLGLALIPLVIGHLLGKKWMGYQVVLTIGLLWVSFGGQASLWSLLAFGLWQTALVKAYSLYRTRKRPAAGTTGSTAGVADPARTAAKPGKPGTSASPDGPAKPTGPSTAPKPAAPQKPANSTPLFCLALLASIAPLFVVKLTPVIDPAHPGSILGFLGISYVTFKTVGTIIEIRDGLIKGLPAKDLLYFVYFLYFFPTLSSGPIDRFRRFRKDLEAPVSQDYAKLLDKGVFYVFLGFLYNFIISFQIDHRLLGSAARAATILPSLGSMTVAMYSYGLYLFFNFAGYSLFAIGVSYIMGYGTPVNFNKPFIATSIHDFWNRWHMSLSFWFRDYVYMRLVKFFIVKKTFKSQVSIANVGYLLNMGLMGCWHGLTPYYIAYGIYHALLMIGYDAWGRFKKRHRIKWTGPWKWVGKGLGLVITFNAVFVGFLIFSGIPYDAILYALGDRTAVPNF